MIRGNGIRPGPIFKMGKFSKGVEWYEKTG